MKTKKAEGESLGSMKSGEILLNLTSEFHSSKFREFPKYTHT